MAMTIHQTAVIGDGAQIHETAQIGPYAVIGANVTIGAGTVIGAHAVIDGVTSIGRDCKIYAGAAIGLDPQDLRYKNEPTGVKIGDRATIREYVTIHRANPTADGDDFTVIGDDAFLMNYCHIAHNCQVGNGVIMANSSTLAGHVSIGDYAVLSGMCILHQWVRVGRFVMLGGMTGSRVDLPPFTICDGRPAAFRGVNVVGLRRGKMNAAQRAAIKAAYKLIYKSNLNTSQAIARIEEEFEVCPEITEICQFIKSSKRGFAPDFSETLESGVMEEIPED